MIYVPKEIWKVLQIPTSKQVDLAEKLGCSLTLAQILALRGIEDPEKAQLFLKEGGPFHSPYKLKDMDKAVKRIIKALDNQEKIMIYGDYDVDGITATAILFDLLEGSKVDVSYYLPDRLEEGYGLNIEAIELLHQNGTDLLITVDCGITSVEIAKEAKEMGMDLIITDHHTPQDTLPEAIAVINPHLNSYPASLCGAGVALKLAQALSREAPHYFQLTPLTVQLAAFGTIADIVDLTDENRRIVKNGLYSMNKEPIPGIKALIDATGITDSEIDATKVSFVLAPKINAAGRIDSAEVGLKMLCEKDYEKALEIAHSLCQLNTERRSIEDDILTEAIEMADQQSHHKALLVAGEKWHSGVIGIVASRLVEKYHKPAVVVGLEDEVCHGSCRSIESFDINKALGDLEEHLVTFGGHKMAAGLSVKKDQFISFQEAFFEYSDTHITEEDLIPRATIDLVADSKLSTSLVEELALLEPCGAGNPKPVIGIRAATLEKAYLVGSNRHLKLQVGYAGESYDAIAFNMAHLEKEIQETESVDIAGYMQINDYQGRRSLNLNVKHLRKSDFLWEGPSEELLWLFWQSLPSGELNHLATKCLEGKTQLDLPKCGIISTLNEIKSRLFISPKVTFVQTSREIEMPTVKPQLVKGEAGFVIDDDNKLLAFIASGAKQCTLSYLPLDYWLWRLFWEVAQNSDVVGIDFEKNEFTKVIRAHHIKYPKDDDLRRIYIYFKSTSQGSIWQESFRQGALDMQNRYHKPFSEDSIKTAVRIFGELGLLEKVKINGSNKIGYLLKDTKQKLDLTSSLSYNEGIFIEQELDKYAIEIEAI